MSVVQAWVAISLIGLLLSLYLANDSRIDLASLRKAKVTNGRRKLARIWLAVDLILASAHAGYVGLGLTLLDRHVNLSGTVVVLIYGNLAMMAVSLLNVSLRHLLYMTRDGEPSIPKPDGVS